MRNLLPAALLMLLAAVPAGAAEEIPQEMARAEASAGDAIGAARACGVEEEARSAS